MFKMKFRFFDILLLILLFIFVNSFPIDLLRIEPIYQEVIRIGLRLLLLSYYIYIFVKNRINIFKFANYKRALLFVPFLLACFSNFIAAGVAGLNFSYIGISPIYISLVAFNLLLSVVLEEILFRYIIQNSLVNASSVKRILGSALIFALFHLLNLVNIRTVDQLIAVLLQVAYTFGLGIMLAIVYEYSYSLPLCMCLHLAFNIFNLLLPNYVFGLAIPDIYFILTAIIISVILVAYIVVLYFIKLKSYSKYFSE